MGSAGCPKITFTCQRGTHNQQIQTAIEEVSSGTLENSTRPLPSWKRKFIEHTGTPFLRPQQGLTTDHLQIREAQSTKTDHWLPPQTRKALATPFPKDQSV